VDRAIDQFGQVIDVYVSPRRDVKAARRFFEKAIGTTGIAPDDVVTDQAPTYPLGLDALLPAVWHRTDRYATNRIEADHSRLKARLRPMRGMQQDRSARIVIAGQALVQHLRRGHDEWQSRSRRTSGWRSRSRSWRSHCRCGQVAWPRHAIRSGNATDPAADRSEQGAVSRLQPRAWNLAAQHAELVAQHEDLQILAGVAAAEQGEQLDGAAQRQVGEFRQYQVGLYIDEERQGTES
jgi:hypothetical protein